MYCYKLTHTSRCQITVLAEGIHHTFPIDGANGNIFRLIPHQAVPGTIFLPIAAQKVVQILHPVAMVPISNPVTPTYE